MAVLTAASETRPIAIPDDRDAVQRHVVRVLAAAQVIGGIGVGTIAAVGALLAADLATESLSGVSSTASVIGAALIAIPVTRVMDVQGRRPGLLLAYAIGFLGAILVVFGATIDSFAVALAGLFLTGGGYTAGMQARYAAADLATPDRRGRSLAMVVWATTIGSMVGPNLASPMGDVAESIGVPRLAGPYLLTMASFVICSVLVSMLLRPDPLLTARRIHSAELGVVLPSKVKRKSVRESLAIITANSNARLGLLAMCIGQAVMVSVMSMTPVHLRHADANLQIIGFVISGHITGMYVASPLFGIAVDRIGRKQVIILGGLILLAAFVVAGTASGHDTAQLAIGLCMLGLGWSATLISGSTLLTESLSLDVRAGVQGTADLTMGMCGAAAGLLSGVVVGLGSYALLNGLATFLVAPLLFVALRSIAVSRAASTAPA